MKNESLERKNRKEKTKITTFAYMVI